MGFILMLKSINEINKINGLTKDIRNTFSTKIYINSKPVNNDNYNYNYNVCLNDISEYLIDKYEIEIAKNSDVNSRLNDYIHFLEKSLKNYEDIG